MVAIQRSSRVLNQIFGTWPNGYLGYHALVVSCKESSIKVDQQRMG